ncbi:hypothetical protein H8K38_00290 [Undibacterium sp. FT79W]|nr:hypothetical protein [Undibacterium sp. FT79W]
MFSVLLRRVPFRPHAICQQVVDAVVFWAGASSLVFFLIHHHFLLVFDCLIFFWVKMVVARF